MKGHCVLLLCMPALSGCVAMGIAGIEAAAVATAVVVPATLATKESAPPEVEVGGTYKDGFWFDRELYSVWVVANGPEEAEKVARDTANNSCAERDGRVQINWFNASQQRGAFMRRINRYSFEMQFRCVRESTGTS